MLLDCYWFLEQKSTCPINALIVAFIFTEISSRSRGSTTPSGTVVNGILAKHQRTTFATEDYLTTQGWTQGRTHRA